ncbi:two-component system response regulator [Paenibacillus sp. J31TS4]|uniref:response regulator n=1 Tax=Paenibacillus sp. J31TS4 TaxID=2807195 RepID=UPI001B0F7273|nr:response regulator [Paenibacillus sp. J31TS4]GIP40225.1 two-component system response regulator [Paenibacillus sp. J31TS4]
MIRVLIVEDDVRIAEINRRFTEKVPGFQVVGIATDGKQAREQLEVMEPDLVLLDLYFPDMNGLDLLKLIQSDYRRTDVIVITAAKEIDTVREAIRGGVVDFVIKPVILERFQEKLQQYSQYRGRLAALEESSGEVGQQEVDELLRGASLGSKAGGSAYLPKGIDRLTMEKVSAFLRGTKESLTAEEVGRRMGVSRSTARRYLEYFVSTGELHADLAYGTVGRPERVYRSKK